MAWIVLTTSNVLRSVTGPERDALAEAATDFEQGDPLVEILADIVREVRGYVAANAQNNVDVDLTKIPEELKGAALSRFRFEAFTRLPIGRELLTQDRVTANENAISLLKDVARGAFAIEQPLTPSSQVIPGGGGVRVVRTGTADHDFSRLGST